MKIAVNMDLLESRKMKAMLLEGEPLKGKLELFFLRFFCETASNEGRLAVKDSPKIARLLGFSEEDTGEILKWMKDNAVIMPCDEGYMISDFSDWFDDGSERRRKHRLEMRQIRQKQAEEREKSGKKCDCHVIVTNSEKEKKKKESTKEIKNNSIYPLISNNTKEKDNNLPLPPQGDGDCSSSSEDGISDGNGTDKDTATAEVDRAGGMFETFMKAYPKKTHLALAENVFRKMAASPDFEDDLFPKIMDSVIKRSKTKNWTKEEGRYVPSPYYFLKDRRWEDPLTKRELDEIRNYDLEQEMLKDMKEGRGLFEWMK